MGKNEPVARGLNRVRPLAYRAVTGADLPARGGGTEWPVDADTALCPQGVYRFLFAESPGLWGAWGTTSTDIAPGQVLVVMPEAVLQMRVDQRFHGCLLTVASDWLIDMLRIFWQEEGLVRLLLADALFELRFHSGVLHLECDATESAACRDEYAVIAREAEGGAPARALSTGAFLKLLGILNAPLLREDEGARLPLRIEIWRAADHIEEAVLAGSPFDLAAVASLVNMSVLQFTRQFRAVVGQAPMEYYQERRILWAARLLLEDVSASITDISHRLGFADTPHFSRRFKSVYGLSPGEFRRRGLDSAGHSG